MVETDDFDVIVVGSGANGGVAAKELAEAGIKVLVLEAGPSLDPEKDLNTNESRNMMRRLYRHVFSGRQNAQSLHGGYWESNPDLFVDDVEHAYSTPKDKPFGWIRGRQVGGRSLTWGGLTLRLSDYELKASSIDGYGKDWPIRYDDLVPYYDKLETFFQVRGGAEKIEQLLAGAFLEEAELTPGEKHLAKAIETQWPDRRLIPARGIQASRHHIPTEDQPWPALSSQATSLKVALESGRTTLRSDSVVSHILYDPATRLATGVEYVHRTRLTKHKVYAKAVILCASTIESVRILLHSVSSYREQGFEESSGTLGRYLMGHVATTYSLYFPSLERSSKRFPLLGSDSFLIPRFRNLGNAKEQFDFIRGYGLWGGIQRKEFLPNILRKSKKGVLGFVVAHGEVLPQYENKISLDTTVKDKWGIPIAHLDCAWGENEEKMVNDMQTQIKTMIDHAGGQCGSLTDFFHVPFFGNHIRKMEKIMEHTPGMYIHEVGGARMGDSPQESVLNSNCQVWGVKNLFVTDGACWTSSGWQNPTLTEMAITARTCQFIVDAMKTGVLERQERS